jgi:hypothetical protein
LIQARYAEAHRSHVRGGMFVERALRLRNESNTEGASAKNQIAMSASVMAHPAEDSGANGTIGLP